MLTVLEGGAQADDRLTERDVPLGPWAGAEVEVWASKTGTVWHGNPDCRELRSRARSAVHIQPAKGSMADVALPGRCHCDPPGELKTYRDAVRSLIRFDAVTYDACAAERSGDLYLPALEERVGHTRLLRDENHDLELALDREPLESLSSACRVRRADVCSHIRSSLADRLPQMVAASWVLGGKTRGRHQSRYAHFLGVAERECEARDVDTSIGIYSYANDRVLPYWLNGVAGGRSLAGQTEALVEKEVERAKDWRPGDNGDLVERIRASWRATGRAWAQILDGIALAHPGEVFAIFHSDQLGLGYELGSNFESLVPHAIVSTDEFSWAAARLPAIFRLVLSERERGLIGLVLDEEHWPIFEPPVAVQFLKNLLIDLEVPHLAEHVTWTDAQPSLSYSSERPIGAELHWQSRGFGTGVRDSGITRERCLPALRAAMSGKELASRSRRQRARKR